jgi:hypothetical protein
MRQDSNLQPDRYERQSFDYLDDLDHAQHGDNVFSVFGLNCPRHAFLLAEAESSITGKLRRYRLSRKVAGEKYIPNRVDVDGLHQAHQNLLAEHPKSRTHPLAADRALVNRAAEARLGLSASIPCADHVSLAGGSRVRGRRHFMPAPLSLPRTRAPC